MSSRVLIVEDDIFIAMALESLVGELGHDVAGLAATRREALALGPDADLALVDLNLKDGPTGAEIGRALAAEGVTVVYMSADPAQLGEGVPGTIGVIAKPATDRELTAVLDYAVAVRRCAAGVPPGRLRLFSAEAA